MRYPILAERLDLLGEKGISVFSTKMLKSYFPEESDISLKKTLERAIKNGVLQRVCRGAYAYNREFRREPFKLEQIAVALRQGEYSYVSLESALSEYSIISQMMINRLTVMTTGRSQLYKTPYGEIEFTHTKRSELEILDRVVRQPGRSLRLAKPDLALEDLKRVSRNMQMVNMDIYKECTSENSLSV